MSEFENLSRLRCFMKDIHNRKNTLERESVSNQNPFLLVSDSTMIMDLLVEIYWIFDHYMNRQ